MSRLRKTLARRLLANGFVEREERWAARTWVRSARLMWLPNVGCYGGGISFTVVGKKPRL